MQVGISLNEYEIKELIKTEVAQLTGESADDLEVYVTCWNGRLSTCCTHIDCKKNLKLPETGQSTPEQSSCTGAQTEDSFGGLCEKDGTDPLPLGVHGKHEREKA